MFSHELGFIEADVGLADRFLMSVAQAKVGLMLAFEMMEKIRANVTGPLSRKEAESLLSAPLNIALNSAVKGADMYKSAL